MLAVSELGHVCQPAEDGLPCAHPSCTLGLEWKAVRYGSKTDGTPGVVVVYRRECTRGRWHWVRDRVEPMQEGTGVQE